MRLEHRGKEVLPVELAALAGTVRLWRDRRAVSTARLRGEDADRVEAGPGWSLALAADGLDVTGGGILTAEVTFVADDAGVYVPVRATGSLPG